MGSCQSMENQELAARNKAIEKQINQDKRAGSSIVKLLLLGAGECGKSTVLKQMQYVINLKIVLYSPFIILHSNGFTEEEINEKKAIVYSNAMDNVLHIPLEDSSKERTNDKAFGFDPSLRDTLCLVSIMIHTPTIAKFQGFEVTTFFADDWGMRHYLGSLAEVERKFTFNFALVSFLDSCARVSEPGYRPTEQDILYSRVATTGVVEVKFKIKELDFRVFDVGGQRSERRKWIHCFDNVESIIFITAISEYDQVLFEDETTNRMIESMQLFNSICNSTWFLSTAMILFLNKKDLFMEKIKRNYDEAVAFIKLKFAELNLNPDKKTIYMHETCATDTNQVQLVISSVIDTIIQKNLQKAGMM
uniref:Uncharacterized protein n=1 Tax=Angiostrongylus cantonensis TaxID=6313 RepID=A0A158P897_ANGCA